MRARVGGREANQELPEGGGGGGAGTGRGRPPHTRGPREEELVWEAALSGRSRRSFSVEFRTRGRLALFCPYFWLDF